MKRILLTTLVLILAAATVFAGTDKGDKTAKVKLDLNVEKVVIGFADSEGNAQKFTATADTYDYEIKSSSSGDTDKVEITTNHADGSMYFFYDAALDKTLNYKLKGKIDTALIQQNEDDGSAATNPDYITYKATVTGNVAADSAFKDGTWVKKDESVELSSPTDAETTSTTYTDIRGNLRGTDSKPYTVAYAGAFKIQLKVDENQNLGAKKAAVYRSTITFAVETV